MFFKFRVNPSTPLNTFGSLVPDFIKAFSGETDPSAFDNITLLEATGKIFPDNWEYKLEGRTFSIYGKDPNNPQGLDCKTGITIDLGINDADFKGNYDINRFDNAGNIIKTHMSYNLQGNTNFNAQALALANVYADYCFYIDEETFVFLPLEWTNTSLTTTTYFWGRNAGFFMGFSSPFNPSADYSQSTGFFLQSITGDVYAPSIGFIDDYPVYKDHPYSSKRFNPGGSFTRFYWRSSVDRFMALNADVTSLEAIVRHPSDNRLANAWFVNSYRSGINNTNTPSNCYVWKGKRVKKWMRFVPANALRRKVQMDGKKGYLMALPIAELPTNGSVATTISEYYLDKTIIIFMPIEA